MYIPKLILKNFKGIKEAEFDFGKLNLFSASPGEGKCLHPNTPVLMFDGQIKKAKDIKVGDKLMGDDSTPRNVLSTTTGQEMMYRIAPVKGESFECNGGHILSLRYTNNGRKCNAFRKSQIVNISVKDYLVKTNDWKNSVKLYRTGVEFEQSLIHLEFSPYVYGLCVGDKRYEGAGQFILSEYKTNSRENRLDLLAGLLDKRGSLNGSNGYVIIIKSKNLNDDILFLARSLGFAAYSKKIKKGYQLSISGDTIEIPLRNKEKAKERKQIKNVLNTGFKVEKFEVGDYAGFTLDGNSLFLLGDFTVTHNSSVLESIVYALTNHLGERIEEYVNWTDEKIKKFEIYMPGMTHLGNTYDLEIKGGKLTAKEYTKKLVVNGDEDVFYKSDVTTELNKLIDPNLMLYSSVSEQKAATSILSSKSDAERLEKLKKILGMDRIANVVELMKMDIREKELEAKILKSEIEQMETKTFEYQDVPELGNIDETKERYKLLKQQKIKYEKEMGLYNEYERQVQEFSNAVVKLTRLEKHIKEIEKEIETCVVKELPDFDEKQLNENIRKKDNLLSEKEKYELLIKNYNEKQTEIKSVQQQIGEYEQKIKNITIKRLKVCGYTKEDLREISDRNINLLLKRTELNNHLECVVAGKCDKCGAEYKDGNVDECKFYVNNNEEQLKLSNATKELIETELENYRQQKQEQESNLKERKSLQGVLDTFQQSLKQKESDLETPPTFIDFDGEIEKCDNVINKLESIRADYENVKQFNETVENKKQEYQNQITGYAGQKKELEKIEKPVEIKEPDNFPDIEFNELQKEINVFEQKKIEIERIEIFNVNMKKLEQENKEKIKENKRNLDTLYFDIKVLKDSKILVDKKFSSFLVERGGKEIQDKTNEFFERSYERYKVVFRQDENSVKFYYTNGERLVPTSMASGFEQDLLTLSFKIGLYQLQKCGLFFLDEICKFADVEKAGDMYRNLLMEDFEQVFVITHKDSTKEMLVNEYNARLFEIENGVLV